MIKKILLTLFLFVSLLGFSQEKTIEDISTAPNPFTNSTKITFSTKSKSTITLKVKNILGKTVFKKEYDTEIGKNTISFYKNDLAAGMYIYSIQNEDSITSKRFVIQ
jgi:hypothetical protein